MRKTLVLAASLLVAAAASATAGTVPASTLKAAVTSGESGIVQIHTGHHACHLVRGKWWRDSRPASKRCWASRRYWRHGHMWYR